MSITTDQRQRVLRFYDAVSGWMRPAVESLAADPDTVFGQARDAFDGLLDEIPYVDRPDHSMAGSMFACTAMLAVFEVLRERGIDAHAWGRATLDLPVIVPAGGEEERERTLADAEASQQGAAPNEFVFEVVPSDETFDRGMNVKSCAICHLFAKRDAMELVPYMCAFDDVMSDAHGQGLRRTGTIALGASHCDFRFKDGGDPLRLASQYPDRIRISEA